MARKQCFLVYTPLGNVARKQYLLFGPSLGNMARKQCFLVCPPLRKPVLEIMFSSAKDKYEIIYVYFLVGYQEFTSKVRLELR